MKPTVSVSIITYNHAPYIRRCIEGALMQKTTFPYEIVIGEDCSTDGTRQIISEYARLFPEIIQVVASDTNVGGGENSKRTDLACRGEFIAYCEGDDYWIDPLKLQKQYDAIIENDAFMVCHGTLVVFWVDGKILLESKVRKALDDSGYISFLDILERNKHFHTSSIFVRSEIIYRLPDWYYQSPVGDYPFKVIAGYLGKVYYIHEIMSVYQKGTSGSYTARKKLSRIEQDGWLSNLEKEHIQMYKDLDKFMEYQYSSQIQDCLQTRHLNVLERSGNLDFLDIAPIKKRFLKLTALLSQSLPTRYRKIFLGKILGEIHY